MLRIDEILVNDNPINDEYFSDLVDTQPGVIRVSNRHLLTEKFKITIKYTGDFRSLYGLVDYSDPSSLTQDEFIFTSTSLVGTSAIFPVIEAPGSKGLFRLGVAVPKDWKVYSNEKSTETVPLNESFTKFWKNTSEEDSDPDTNRYHAFKFIQTKSIPFNSLNIVAGKISEIKTKTAYQGRKINVYCMESQQSKVSGTISEYIGKAIKTTIAKLEKLTGFKYPYSKCDILVLPERLGLPNFFGTSPIKVNREYPGLTTIYLRDFYNYKSQFTYELVASIAKLWFGQLVSPSWWSEQWLSESLPRYIALRILKDDFLEYELTSDSFHTLYLWLKSQALYLETLADYSKTNIPLRSPELSHSYDALFLDQSVAQRVGPFQFEELFAFYSPEVYQAIIAGLVGTYSWKSISASEFISIFTQVTEPSAEVASRLDAVFGADHIEDIKFHRTSPTDITVERITRADAVHSQSQIVDLALISAAGSVVKTEIHIVSDNPQRIPINANSVSFLSLSNFTGLYYEIYDKDELDRLFLAIGNSGISTEIRCAASRILFTNAVKGRTISLVEVLRYLKILIENANVEEQKWIVRSFSLLTKHIARGKITSDQIQEFTRFLLSMTAQNAALIPYIGYFGMLDMESRNQVIDFTTDFVNATTHNPVTSLLNYDLVKWVILLEAQLNLDLDRAKILADLVSKYDPFVGSTIHGLFRKHASTILVSDRALFNELKEIFTNEPNYNNAIEYYYMMQLIRTDTSPDMVPVRDYLTEIVSHPEKYNFGGKKSSKYINIGKALHAAKRHEDQKGESTLTSTTDMIELLNRRNKTNFRLL